MFRRHFLRPLLANRWKSLCSKAHTGNNVADEEASDVISDAELNDNVRAVGEMAATSSASSGNEFNVVDRIYPQVKDAVTQLKDSRTFSQHVQVESQRYLNIKEALECILSGEKQESVVKLIEKSFPGVEGSAAKRVMSHLESLPKDSVETMISFMQSEAERIKSDDFAAETLLGPYDRIGEIQRLVRMFPGQVSPVTIARVYQLRLLDAAALLKLAELREERPCELNPIDVPVYPPGAAGSIDGTGVSSTSLSAQRNAGRVSSQQALADESITYNFEDVLGEKRKASTRRQRSLKQSVPSMEQELAEQVPDRTLPQMKEWPVQEQPLADLHTTSTESPRRWEWIFTDISEGIADEEKPVYVRTADGDLREATQPERRRALRKTTNSQAPLTAMERMGFDKERMNKCVV